MQAVTQFPSIDKKVWFEATDAGAASSRYPRLRQHSDHELAFGEVN